MMNKIYDILDLMRLKNIKSHVGYLLIFIPSLLSIELASEGERYWKLIGLFFIGSVIMRSAGCIINDILDKDFDKQVSRTCNRPIATGKISVIYAIFLCLLLCLFGLIILLQFSYHAILMGVASLFFVVTYPLCKRFTYLPQLYLGITFNLGVLIASVEVNGIISIEAWILYLGMIFWTLYYDTIYGFSDIKDDKKAGVKSLSLFLEKKAYKYWLGFFGVTANCLVFVAFSLKNANILSGFLIMIFNLLIIYAQLRTLNISESENCLSRFRSNIYIGLLWSIYGIC